MNADIMFNEKILQMFRPASQVEVKDIIIKSWKRSCAFDPLPIWLLKKCMDQLLSPMKAIIDRCMDESVVPLCLKGATIIQQLKRSWLDKENVKSCHTISNLPFISQRIEKIVLRSRKEPLEQNNLHDSYQSAYGQTWGDYILQCN